MVFLMVRIVFGVTSDLAALTRELSLALFGNFRQRALDFVKNLAWLPILLISFIPRYWGLDIFLTPDEFLWIDRSRNFLLALSKHDWIDTFQTGHPGVTTMWSGTLGFYLYGVKQGFIHDDSFIKFLSTISWDNIPIPLLFYMRMATVSVTSCGIVGVYFLLKRLFTTQIALIAALMLALDPWYLAHSRVLHHDAFMSTFMLLSALTLLSHLWHKPVAWLLLSSGVFAGLALLSKALALFLLPWTVALFIFALLRGSRSILQTIIDSAIWGVTTILTVFIAWPALWLAPTDTLWRIFQTIVTYAVNPHEKGQFFLGQTVADPGVLYYPVVILFAVTPLVTLGIITLVIHNFSSQKDGSKALPALLLLMYVVGYIGFISSGEKKHERYLLPAILMLNVVAAVGIDFMINRLQRQVYNVSVILSKWRFSRYSLLLSPQVTIALVILCIQCATTLPHFPYYFSYYNPLLGGNRVAEHTMLIGWGEGIDQAATYLNQLPNAEQLKVISNFPDALALHFHGKPMLWFPTAKIFAADYFVLYRRERQQEYPDAALLDYIAANWPLEHTISVQGIPYVWIYRAPAANWTQSIDDRLSAPGALGLLGYKISRYPTSSSKQFALTLYRQRLPNINEQWYIRLNHSQEASQSIPLASNPGPGTAVGEIFEETVFLNNSINFTSVNLASVPLQIGLREATEPKVVWHSLINSSHSPMN